MPRRPPPAIEKRSQNKTPRRGKLRRMMARCDPIALVLLVTAVFVWLTGKPVHALFLGTIGLVLAWTTLRTASISKQNSQQEPNSILDCDESLPREQRALQASSGSSSGLATVTDTATLVVYDTEGKRESEHTHQTYHGVLMTVAGLVFALVVAAFPRFSWPATISVMAIAAFAVTRAWEGAHITTDERRPSDKHHSRAGPIAWVVLFCAGAPWELAALLQQPSLREGSHEHPTISVLMDGLLAGYWGRMAGTMMD